MTELAIVEEFIFFQIGKIQTNLALMLLRSTTIICNGETQEAIDSKGNVLHSNRLLNGLGFGIGSTYFSIFNAFDETGFSYLRDDNLIYTKL